MKLLPSFFSLFFLRLAFFLLLSLYGMQGSFSLCSEALSKIDTISSPQHILLSKRKEDKTEENRLQNDSQQRANPQKTDFQQGQIYKKSTDSVGQFLLKLRSFPTPHQKIKNRLRTSKENKTPKPPLFIDETISGLTPCFKEKRL